MLQLQDTVAILTLHTDCRGKATATLEFSSERLPQNYTTSLNPVQCLFISSSAFCHLPLLGDDPLRIAWYSNDDDFLLLLNS